MHPVSVVATTSAGEVISAVALSRRAAEQDDEGAASGHSFGAAL